MAVQHQVTAYQLEMMRDVVENNPDSRYFDYYKSVLANHTLKAGVKGVEQTQPKGKGGHGYGKKKVYGPTAPQIELIERLLTERETPMGLREKLLTPELTFKGASAAITLLSGLPKKEVATEKPLTKKSTGSLAEDGFYFKEGRYYKVKTNVKTGRRSASMWYPETKTWGYCKGMVYKLTVADKVTAEIAEEFGTLYARCMACNHALSNDVSVAAAIGPVCRSKLGF